LVLIVAAPAFRLLPSRGEIIVAGIAFFAAHATLSAVIPSQVSKLAGRSGGTGHGFQLVIAYLGTLAGGALAGVFATHLLDAFAVLAVSAALAVVLLWRGVAQASSERPTASGP
jgi:predicted MFS family arabinose efflux permease